MDRCGSVPLSVATFDVKLHSSPQSYLKRPKTSGDGSSEKITKLGFGDCSAAPVSPSPRKLFGFVQKQANVDDLPDMNEVADIAAAVEEPQVGPVVRHITLEQVVEYRTAQMLERRRSEAVRSHVDVEITALTHATEVKQSEATQLVAEQGRYFVEERERQLRELEQMLEHERQLQQREIASLRAQQGQHASESQKEANTLRFDQDCKRWIASGLEAQSLVAEAREHVNFVSEANRKAFEAAVERMLRVVQGAQKVGEQLKQALVRGEYDEQERLHTDGVKMEKALGETQREARQTKTDAIAMVAKEKADAERSRAAEKVEKVKEAIEKKKQAQQQAEQQEKTAASKGAATEAATGTGALVEYCRRMKLRESIEQQNNELAKEESLRGEQRRIKMGLNRLVNQLVPERKAVNEAMHTLEGILQSAERVSPPMATFAYAQFAQKVVENAAKQSQKDDGSWLTIFPLAALCVFVCATRRDATEIFLAQLNYVCPYTIPVFLSRQEGQSSNDHKLVLGYREVSEGELESETAFFVKMRSYIALYAACLTGPSPPNVPHPFGPSLVWTWMARSLNVKPWRVSPLVLCEFLRVAGATLTRTYGRQARKLLMLLAKPYIAAMPEHCEGNVARLTSILESYRNGLLPEPVGKLS